MSIKKEMLFKIFGVLLLIVIVSCYTVLANDDVLTPQVTDVTEALQDAFDYQTDGANGIIITGYTAAKNSAHPSVIIPSQIDGKNVTKIGGNAFYEKGLTSVEIPETVIDIQYQAFQANELTSISLPPYLKSLGRHAFFKNKITSVVIPGTLGTNGGKWEDGTFNDNLLKSVEIKEGVTAIPSDFYFEGISPGDYKNRISTLVLPSTLKSIGAYAFNQQYIPFVNLPSSVEIVGEGAFSLMTASLSYTIKNDKNDYFDLPEGMDPKKIKIDTNGWAVDVVNRKIFGPHDSRPGSFKYIIGNVNGKDVSVSIDLIYGQGKVEIRFLDYDNRIIEERTVAKNADISIKLPTSPSRDGYYFTGWSNDGYFDNIYFSVDFIAEYLRLPVFTVNDLVIKGGTTFDPLNGVTAKGVYDNDLTGKIKVIENNVDTSKEGTYKVVLEVTDKYTAGGNPLTSIKEYSVTVEFERVTVRFLDYDNTILEEQSVILNDTAKPTVMPTRLGYTFIGWDKSLENMTESMDFKAQYKALPQVTAKDMTITVGSDFNPKSNIKAIDADGNTVITDNITITSNMVNINEPGTYTVSYKVTDSWGGVVIGSYNVIVENIMENKVLTDSTTAIVMKGYFAKKSQLVVDVVPINDNVLKDEVMNRDVVGSYEVYIIGEYKGEITITFPIKQIYNGKKIYISHQKHDQTIERFERTAVNGKVSVTVDELSPFTLTVDKQSMSQPDKPIIPPVIPSIKPTVGTQVKTADNTKDIGNMFVLLTLSGFVVVGLCITKKKVKSNN